MAKGPEGVAHAFGEGRFKGFNTVAEGFVNGIARIQSAADKQFRAAATSFSIGNQARAEAITLFKQGKIAKGQLKAVAQKFIDNPPEHFLPEAYLDQAIAVFGEPTFAGRAVESLKRFEVPLGVSGLRFPLGKVTIEPVAPFAKVTSNVVLQSVVDFSPIGLTKGATELAFITLFRDNMTLAQQRNLAKTIGNGATGSAIMGIGYQLGAVGAITGAVAGGTEFVFGPNKVSDFLRDPGNSLEVTPFRSTDPAINAKAEFEGRTPGSIMLNGKFRNVVGMGPGLDQLIMGATVYQADLGKLVWNQVRRDMADGNLELTDELIENSLQTVYNGVKLAVYDIPVGILQDLPLAQGPTELVKFGEALSRADSGQDWFKAFAAFGGKILAGRFVPSGVAAVAQQTDPVKRRTRANQRDSVLDAFVNPFKARNPLLRKTLERDLDVGGRAVPLGGFEIPGTDLELPGADPFRSTTPRTRLPLSKEIDRFKLGVNRLVQGPDEPNAAFTGRQHRRMDQIIINLNELRFDPNYKNLPDGLKESVLRQAMNKAARQIGR